MEENKASVDVESKTEVEIAEDVEVTVKVEVTTKPQATTEVKKNNFRKYVAIFAIAFLALAIIAAAIVWVVLGGQRGEEPETPETPEEPEESYVQISIEDISKYILVCAADTSDKSQYWKLRSQIEKMCGVKPVAELDCNIAASEYEILVGNTNREESKTFLSNLLWDDYGYAIVGNKIVIAGHTDEGTTNAIKHFLEHLKNEDHETVFFSNKNQYLFRHSYISDTFMLNGIDVSRAKIVVNGGNNNLQIAQTLSQKSREVCGRSPKIVTDLKVNEGDSLIIIGTSSLVPDAMQAEWEASYATTEDKSAYYVRKENNIMWIYTPVMEGYGAINRELLSQIQSESATSATLSTGLVQLPQFFTVMSFNVYVSQFNTARKDRVIATIRENAPSVFGVQEANESWMTALRTDLGDEYVSVGVGRDANLKGEYSAIFYRKDLFTLVDSGTKWLSDTPDVSGSKFTQANYPRIMTYAVLERKTDGAQLLYVNTHLDHNGKNNSNVEVAEMVRQKQIEVLLSEVAKLPDLPTVVTGDFNVTPEASAYTTMTANGYLDASHVAWAGEVQPTYNGMDDSYDGIIIDYIFVSPDLAGVVDSYIVCPEKRDGEWISDHNAIIATITLPVIEEQE